MVAEKAEESLEAIRTGRIDAGDLKRLNPFSGGTLPLFSATLRHVLPMHSLSGLTFTSCRRSSCTQMEGAIG